MLREKQAAPDFTLEAMDGSRLSLQETLAKGPALLVFLVAYLIYFFIFWPYR